MEATVLIVGALAAWLILSALNQVRDGTALTPLRRLDVGSLLPAWTFFAPRPGVTDHVLVYRDFDEAGRRCPGSCCARR